MTKANGCYYYCPPYECEGLVECPPPSLADILAPSADVCDGCGETRPIFAISKETLINAAQLEEEEITCLYCWECADTLLIEMVQERKWPGEEGER